MSRSPTPIHPMTTSRAVAEPVDDEPLDALRPRSYTSADYETAYHVWAGPGGRSLRRTGALLGIANTTLNRWHERFDWGQRYSEGAASSALTASRESDRIVQDLITAGQVPAIVALHEIIADPGHRRRDVAALAMLALGGRPLPKAPTITATRQLGDGSTIAVKLSDLGPLSPQELAHYARTGELPASVASPAEVDPEG